MTVEPDPRATEVNLDDARRRRAQRTPGRRKAQRRNGGGVETTTGQQAHLSMLMFAARESWRSAPACSISTYRSSCHCRATASKEPGGSPPECLSPATAFSRRFGGSGSSPRSRRTSCSAIQASMAASLVNDGSTRLVGSSSLATPPNQRFPRRRRVPMQGRPITQRSAGTRAGAGR